MEDSDRAAIERAKAGDSEAFRVLVERHSRAIFRLAWRMLGNESDAEDVVQETFLRAFRQFDQFGDKASFGTWIYRIAVNYSLDLLRARKRHVPVESEPGSVEPLMNVASREPLADRKLFSSQVRNTVDATLSEMSPDGAS